MKTTTNNDRNTETRFGFVSRLAIDDFGGLVEKWVYCELTKVNDSISLTAATKYFPPMAIDNRTIINY